MNASAWKIRDIGPWDIDVVCHHRDEMFIAAGREPAVVAQMRAPFREWLLRQFESNLYYGYVAEREGRIAGGVGLIELDWPPHALHPLQARRGYVLNVFVEPEFRGAGCARALMAAAEAEMRRRGIAYAALHASDAGRPLYEAMGWNATNEMAKRL